MAVPPAHRSQMIAWRSLRRLRGEPVTYHFTTEQSVEIDRVVLTRPKSKAANPDGVTVVQSRRWDCLIGPDDLQNAGEPTAPASGHWIIRHKDGARFDVVTPETSDTPWRWGDASQAFRRVHFVER